MILAFDAATDRLTIAVGTADNIIAEVNEDAPRAHLNRLLPGIDNLVKDATINLSGIDYIAVGVGPGSFTGLRIAVATAQALAHALNRPLVGISTLDAIAAEAADGADTDIYPVLDGKRREVYTAGYDCHGRRFTDYQVLFPQALAEKLAAGSKPVFMAGDGLQRYSSIFVDRLGPAIRLAEASTWPPRASVLIRLAEEKIDKGEVGPYFQVMPIYIRSPDAKEPSKREK